MEQKTSIRYYNNTPVRSRWDDINKKWWYSAVDIVFIITGSENSRRYWNTYKSRHNEVSTVCGQLKMKASDGKYYFTDVLDANGINILLMNISGNNKQEIANWVKGLASPIDEESRARAYELYSNKYLDSIGIGTVDGLIKIHKYLFEGLYSFAGKIRNKNISKGGFTFANSLYLQTILSNIEKMKEDNIENIIKKYVEMNIAHPFLEGNGRTTRIWLDLIIQKNLKKSIDWSKIDKKEYLKAMEESPTNINSIYQLISQALTDDINNHELFMKGIDYSYYYEEID